MLRRSALLALLFLFFTDVSAQRKKPDERKKLAFEQAFMNGQKAMMTGNLEKAYDLFKECTGIDPKQAAPFYKLSELCLKKNQLDDALKFSNLALKLDPENKWFVLQQAQILEQQGNYEKAAARYEQLTELAPDELVNYDHAANMYWRAGEFDEAIKIYDELEKRIGVNEDVVLQKQRLYLIQKKQSKAATEIQKLIDRYPDEPRYQVMLAELYVTDNETEKAMGVYQKILSRDSSNGLAHLALSDYWRKKGERQKAFSELKQAFGDERMAVQIKVQAMGGYVQEKNKNDEQKKEAYTLAGILCEKHPNEADGHLVYGDLLEKDKQYKEAREQYRQALLVDPNQPATWQKAIACSIELKQFAAAATDCEKAIEYFPTVMDFYLFNCLAHMEQKQYEQAITIAKMGFEASLGDPQTQARLLSNWADAANYLKRYNQSDSLYEKALELDPENTYALNNYAYFLSVRKERLTKAEELSRITIEKDGENPTYLDTYGWILYQQKKYSEALLYLEKAVKATPDNAEVNEHFGDLQYQLGNKEKAVAYWKRALDLDPDRGLWLEKKINEQKISE